MLISEFARRAGISPDTVRFYVRKGLIQPELGQKGGSNPYQIFTAEHLDTAKIIKLAQTLGFTLREIAILGQEYAAVGMSLERRTAIMRSQLEKIEAKARQIEAVRAYMRDKIAWMEGGETGPEPRFLDRDCALKEKG
jgi:Predicted transcriptional regulators